MYHMLKSNDSYSVLTANMYPGSFCMLQCAEYMTLCFHKHNNNYSIYNPEHENDYKKLFTHISTINHCHKPSLVLLRDEC